MSNTVLLVLLGVVALIVIVAFMILSVRKTSAGNDSWKQAADHKSTDELSSSDFRSKKIKCDRCGAAAYGVLGTENIYRCRSCGFRTKGPTVAYHSR